MQPVTLSVDKLANLDFDNDKHVYIEVPQSRNMPNINVIFLFGIIRNFDSSQVQEYYRN